MPESLAYAYVPNVFAVTNYQQDATFLGAEKVVNVEACVATYGYDGLSAYERAVMLGMTTLSERDWIMTFVANKNFEERIAKLEQLVKQYHPDADIDDYTEVTEYSDIEISLTYPSEKAAVAGGVIEPVMWGYMQEKITKVGGVVTGRESITTGAVVRFSNAGTSAEQGFASVDAATGKVTWNENSLNVERSIYVKLEVTLNGKTNVKSVKLTQQAKAVTPAIYGTLKLGDAQDVATKLRKMVVSAVEDGGYSIEKHEVAVVQQHIASSHTNTYDVVLSGDAQACAFFLLPQEYVGKGIVHCAGVFGDESLTNSGGIANVDDAEVEISGKTYRLFAYVDNALLEDIEYKFGMV